MKGRKGRRKKGRRLGSEQPACQRGTRCQLQQETCYSWTLLGREMGMGGEYKEQDSQVDLCICLSTHSSNKTMAIDVERQLLIEL